MAINFPYYNINGLEVTPFRDDRPVENFYAHTGTMTNPTLPFVESNAFNIFLYENINTSTLYLIGVLNMYDPLLGTDLSSVDLTIGGLGNGHTVVFTDNVDEIFTEISTGTIQNNYIWEARNTDGFIIEVVQPFSDILITVGNYSGTLNRFNIITNDEASNTILFDSALVINILPDVKITDDVIVLDPPAGVYSVEKKIQVYVNDTQEGVVYTDDGSSPTLAEYIAYDTNNPPLPFIAVVQDGRGNVTFDGGFPKFYNTRHNSAWQTFSDLSPTFRYFYNVLHYISNDDKVSQGNNKILFLGDVSPASGSNYCIRGTRGSDFELSIEKICQVAGFQSVYRTVGDYPNGIMDMSFSFLDQHCAIVLFSTNHTSATNKMITPQTISNIVAFRESNNGLFIITDHGTGDNGFYVTANLIATEFGAYFEGNFNRSPVNVGFLRSTYGDHALYNNLADSEDIYAGGSESRVYVTEREIYTSYTVPVQTLITIGEYQNFSFLLRDFDSSINTYAFTYGLQVAQIINFLDNINNTIEVFDLGVDRMADIEFEISDAGGMGTIEGLIRHNSATIGDFTYTTSGGLTKTFFDGFSERIVDDNDVIVAQVTSPLRYTRNITVNRFQPDIENAMSYADFIRRVYNDQWVTDRTRTMADILSYIQNDFDVSVGSNVTKVKQYLRRSD